MVLDWPPEDLRLSRLELIRGAAAQLSRNQCVIAVPLPARVGYRHKKPKDRLLS